MGTNLIKNADTLFATPQCHAQECRTSGTFPPQRPRSHAGNAASSYSQTALLRGTPASPAARNSCQPLLSTVGLMHA